MLHVFLSFLHSDQLNAKITGSVLALVVAVLLFVAVAVSIGWYVAYTTYVLLYS